MSPLRAMASSPGSVPAGALARESPGGLAGGVVDPASAIGDMPGLRWPNETWRNRVSGTRPTRQNPVSGVQWISLDVRDIRVVLMKTSTVAAIQLTTFGFPCLDPGGEHLHVSLDARCRSLIVMSNDIEVLSAALDDAVKSGGWR